MIAPADLAALMQSDAPHAVLDLREKGTYETGHIFRATSLPRRLLEFRLPALVTATATPLVIYDEDGRLAELAAPTLRELGYTDVRPLAGGLAAWRAAGRPVVQGLNVPSKVFGERMLHELKTPQIPPHALAGRIERGEDLVIVDSRTPEEYARGCVPGAVSVPGGELVLRIGALLERPETTIVVHCGGRTRSYIGAESLRRMSLPNPVVALENGTMGWELAGLTLERGAARWAPPVTANGKALASLAAERVAAEEGIRLVSPEELRALRAHTHQGNLYVLDVRTADEYAAGHVAGAVWAPGGQAVQATDEYVAVRAAAIVLVCDGFVRSVMTAAWLGRMGLPSVGVLAGGLPGWEQAGGAVEKGQAGALPAGYETAWRSVAHAKPGDLGTVLVLNVDQSDAYARGHVPGAAWLCRSRLELTIAAAAPDRGQPIVVTCADGHASTLAAATLGRLGYGRASVLEGGTRAWEQAGRPVERGRTRLLDTPDDVVLKPYERGREAMERYLRWEEDLDQEGRSPSRLL
ncbi:MAG: rhodanese-like domain-containing protein [candidate division NC10 bacterium]